MSNQNFNLAHKLDCIIQIGRYEFVNAIYDARTVTGALYERDKDKKEALKLLKGAEEQFVGMCARCFSTGLLAKKYIYNDHYGCTDNYCCPLLHQWNVCDDCLKVTRTNFHPVKYPERQVEHLKFQRVFSRLPDDVHRYIGEFVPQVFAYVKMSGQLFRSAKLFYNIDRHSKLLKSLWVDSLYDKYYSNARFLGKRIYMHSSGKEICRCLKKYYRAVYREYYLEQEVLQAPWYSVQMEFYSSNNNWSNTTVEFLTQISNLLSSA